MLYFIDDVDNTREQNSQNIEHIRTLLWDKLKRLGPKKTADYIKQQLDSWETEKVRFAIAGKSSTGKSIFINIFRASKRVKMALPMLDFETKRRKFQNINIQKTKTLLFCYLPGLSLKFTKVKFLEMVNLSEYSFIFIFFESVLTEDSEWLTIQIQEKGIPFCLVR